MTVEPAQQEIINQLKSIDFGSLERTEELGRDYSFKVAVDQMREINSDILNIVENAGAIRIPNDVQQQVFSIAQRLVNISNNIRNFILKGNEGNASSQYQSIFNEVTGLVQEDLRVIVPLIERINILKLNTKDVENNIAKALNSIKEIEGIKTQAEHSKDNIDLAIKEVRDALGKEGALISANEFHKQAVEHEELAKIWFNALIG